MDSASLAICHSLLKQTHARVVAAFPSIKPYGAAYVMKTGRQNYEFHGPDNFYWFGRAYCASEARHKGWNAWLESKGVTQ